MKPKKATAPSDSQRDSQDWKEEFDKKVEEVGHGADFTKGEDGEVSEFGFKTLRGDEIFTVTDFGNIKAFIQQQKDKSFQAGFQEAVGKIKDIYYAWNNPGPEPEYHRGWQETLRSDWPTLARALDQLKLTPDQGAEGEGK